MKAVRTLAQAAFCLSTMSSLAAAWPTWMQDLHLAARQDEGDGDENAPEQTRAPETTTRRSLNTATTRDPDAPRETGKPTGTGRAGGGGNSTKTREEFDPTDPVGSAILVTPDARLGQPLYKAGEFVTWVWNYTNVLADPTAIDVILSLPAESATWTLAANHSYENPQTFTWDSEAQRTDPAGQLLTAQYKVIVHDSDEEIDAPPEPGYLTSSEFSIGVYIPKEAIPLDEWTCATCSAAPPGLDQRALAFASSMALVSVFTFTWFVAGLNL